jgi:hypothetical protein
MRRSAAGIVLVLCLQIPAAAANFTIDNPAGRIKNPADRMYNPATQTNNPAANIYNPAKQADNPNPISPPTQLLPPPAATVVTAKPAEKAAVRPVIPQKSYGYKTVKAYIDAAKKAFFRDDYSEFLAVTEDALRRIDAGTLKASKKTKQKLARYKVFGYGLLEKSEE